MHGVMASIQLVVDNFCASACAGGFDEGGRGHKRTGSQGNRYEYRNTVLNPRCITCWRVQFQPTRGCKVFASKGSRVSYVFDPRTDRHCKNLTRSYVHCFVK